MKRNKNGFTLIELLAVIVILGIIMTIATTNVIKSINNSREKSKEIAKKEIISYAEAYFATNNSNTDCVSVEKLYDLGYLTGDVTNPETGKNITNKSELRNQNICKTSASNIPNGTTTEINGYKYVITPKDSNSAAEDNKKQDSNTKDNKNQDSNVSKTYKIGDKFCLNKDKECFYVIKNNEKTVKALAEYNLFAGNTVTFSNDCMQLKTNEEISSSEKGYGLQNKNMTIINWGGECIPKVVGVVEFSLYKNYAGYSYWTTSNGELLNKFGKSYPANVFDSYSSLFDIVKNYKKYINDDLGKKSADLNLITYEELIGLGCDGSNNKKTCTSADKFVYSTNYWTTSAASADSVWTVFSNGTFNPNSFQDPARFGIRPVITINKNEI